MPMGQISRLEAVRTRTDRSPVTAVVIPCYRVSRHIRQLLEGIGAETSRIYCVDDACPEGSAEVIEARSAADPRLRVIRHERNQGVGAAVVTGYKAALADGADIIVKLDGDGQMDPRFIPQLIAPLVRGEADYVKGNRFLYLEDVENMPFVRVIGNAGLSFLTKFSTGYWTLFDPTNGYTAIHASVAERLPLDKLSKGFFFESDVLFRLSTIRAVVKDIPLRARYGTEKSNISITATLFQFPILHLRNLLKRIYYNYFLRNFSMASINLMVGLLLSIFGITYGAVQWMDHAVSGTTTPAGTVMLAGLPVMLGVLLLVSFLAYDINNQPRDTLHKML